MRSAIGLVAVVREIREKHWPERIAARINCRPRQVLPENAVALVLELGNLALNPIQSAPPAGSV